MRPIAICALMLAAMPCFSTNAATIFTNKASFHASTGPLMFESFESFPPTSWSPGDLSEIDAGPFALTNSAGTNDFDVWRDGSFAYIHATVGRNCVVWYANVPSTSFTFTFDTPINAFGVNIIGWGYGDPGDTSPLTFSTSSGEVGIAAANVAVAGNVQFFGMVGSPFTAITFSRPHENITATIDDVYFGVVPEPQSGLLASVACSLLATSRRRRRK